MSLLGKPFDSLDESDLQALVENKALESKYLEYKVQLPGDVASEKKEFLADVSSLANASGGDLVFGNSAKDGVTTDFCGLKFENLDREVSRLENMVRDGIAPRISAHIRPVGKPGSKVAVVIRVRKSWAAPHMVTFNDHSKFYSRNSNGKYPLDVSELRAAFLLTETVNDRVWHFRRVQLARIRGEQTPVPLVKNPKIVLHLIPFVSFDPGTWFDLSSLSRDWRNLRSPYLETTPEGRFNFDGYLAFTRLGDKPPFSYLQVFRNGIIEMVDAYLLHDGKINTIDLEGKLFEALPRYVSVLQHLGIDPPIFLFVSLLGVQGFTIVSKRQFSMDSIYPIDRENLLLPELILDEHDLKWEEVMKPIFDAIWNSAGWPRSMNYNEEGKWKP